MNLKKTDLNVEIEQILHEELLRTQSLLCPICVATNAVDVERVGYVAAEQIYLELWHSKDSLRLRTKNVFWVLCCCCCWISSHCWLMMVTDDDDDGWVVIEWV